MRIRRNIRINKPKKIELKNIDKKEHSDINKYNKLIQNFYKYITKKNKPDDFEKFQKDIFEILDSKYCIYNHIKKILNIIKNRHIIKNFIEAKFRQIQDNYYNLLFNKNNLDIVDINYNDEEFKLLCLKENNNYTDFIINLIDKVYKKFNKIEENFIVDLFRYYTLDIDKVLIHLKTHNFRFNNTKNIKKLHYSSEVDYFYLLNNHDIKYILTSYYTILNFNNIDNIIQKYFPNPDYDYIFSILINLLIETERNTNFNIGIIASWILNKKKSINPNIKIKIYTLHLIKLMYTFIYNIDIMNDDDYKQQFINYRLEDHNNYNLINKTLKKNIITKKEFTLEQLIEADELIINMLLKNVNFRKKILVKNNIKYSFKNIKSEEYDYFLDYHDIVVYTGYNMIDIDIYISFINKNRLVFINNLVNYIKKITNLNDIIYCKLFHNKNKLFTLDEKVNILKKIYSGKIKANDLELFILNNNELACHFIKNIPINNKYVKYALSVGNLKFIETLCELKYNFTTNDLLNITSDLYLEEILNSINKYNTINFMENLDWYNHIKYILNINNNNMDILKVIYNDDNQDLRDLFNEKIQEVKFKYNFDELNNLNFNEFCIQIIKENIKLSNYDIHRLSCLKKRLFILNY